MARFPTENLNQNLGKVLGKVLVEVLGGVLGEVLGVLDARDVVLVICCQRLGDNDGSYPYKVV